MSLLVHQPANGSPITNKLTTDPTASQLGDMFSMITEEPVNAASLGQVYRGRLRATGEEVAVKVQRPGIADSIAMDMLLLRRLMVAVDTNITQVCRFNAEENGLSFQRAIFTVRHCGWGGVGTLC